MDEQCCFYPTGIDYSKREPIPMPPGLPVDEMPQAVQDQIRRADDLFNQAVRESNLKAAGINNAQDLIMRVAHKWITTVDTCSERWDNDSGYVRCLQDILKELDTNAR